MGLVNLNQQGALADGVNVLDASDAADTRDVTDAVDALNTSDAADAANGFDGTLSLKSDVELSPKVISTLEDHSAAFSPAAEASTASSAARGIHAAETQSRQNASNDGVISPEETVQYLNYMPVEKR